MPVTKKPYRKFNRVPDAIREEIRSLYDNGMSSLEIARKFEVSKHCVLSILKELECSMRNNKKFEELENRIISDYLESKNAAKVAKKYITSNTQVFKILERHSVPSFGRGVLVGKEHPHWKGGAERKKEKMLEYVKKRYAEEPLFKIEHLCRQRILSFLKTVNKKKKKKTIELLGADWIVVRAHIESKFVDDMSWENHGTKGWHVDHIVPLASARTEAELLKLFHYTNLQPLWHKENLVKSSFHDGIHWYRKNRSLS